MTTTVKQAAVFVRDGKKCNMKFLDTDVKRALASVSAMRLSTRETSSRSERGNRTPRWTMLCVRRQKSRRASTILDTPSEQERIEHEMTHLSFRSRFTHITPKEEDASQLRKRNNSHKPIRIVYRL